MPALMEAAHVRSIRRFSLGLIRCHVRGTGVDCRLLYGPRVLSLVDERTDRAAGRVVRRWRITPGLLVRATRVVDGVDASPGAPGTAAPLGTLTLGVERGGAQELHAWMRVEAFPSRFLAPVSLRTFGLRHPLPRRVPRLLLPVRVLAWAWAGIGRLYGTYHSRAADSALAFLAQSLGGIV